MKSILMLFIVSLSAAVSFASSATAPATAVTYDKSQVTEEVATAILSEKFVKLFVADKITGPGSQIIKIDNQNYYMASDNCGFYIQVSEKCESTVPRHPELDICTVTAKAITGTMICGPYF